MRSQTPEMSDDVSEITSQQPNTTVHANNVKSRPKLPRKLRRPSKNAVRKKKELKSKVEKPRRPNPHPPPAGINEPTLDAMKEVSGCWEIPEAERQFIRKCFNCKGELIYLLNEYETMELDLDDPNYERRFELRERKREKICQELETANEWINERIDFIDAEDAEQLDRVYVTATKCERLNEMLTEFVNDTENREEKRSIRSGCLRSMIHELSDEERRLLGPTSEVETDEFVVLLACKVRHEVREVLFNRWQEAALPNGQTSPRHDEADTNGVFPEQHLQDLNAKRQETIKFLAKHAAQDDLERVDSIMENMFEPSVVTIDDVELDDEAAFLSLLPTEIAVETESAVETDDDDVWLHDEDSDIEKIFWPTTPSARSPPANLVTVDNESN